MRGMLLAAVLAAVRPRTRPLALRKQRKQMTLVRLWIRCPQSARRHGSLSGTVSRDFPRWRHIGFRLARRDAPTHEPVWQPPAHTRRPRLSASGQWPLLVRRRVPAAAPRLVPVVGSAVLEPPRGAATLTSDRAAPLREKRHQRAKEGPPLRAASAGASRVPQHRRDAAGSSVADASSGSGRDADRRSG